MLGLPLLPHLAAPDRKAWLKHLWESRLSPGQVITMLRLQPRDGAERKVQFATRRQHAAGRQATWFQTAMLDITEKSDAETALSASEAKFRMLAESIGEVFWFMELDPPRVTYVSPAFEKIWGVPAADVYADNEAWMKAIHPDDLEAVHTAFHRWISDESDTFRVEYRVLNREGQIRWITDRGSVLGRKDGRPHQISGIARDITDRKCAEEELRLRNTELSAKYDELERFNRAMVDRELRMIELKKEINDLLAQAGQPPRYRVEFAASAVASMKSNPSLTADTPTKP
jgi:PAS domain S-box-containing protein